MIERADLANLLQTVGRDKWDDTRIERLFSILDGDRTMKVSFKNFTNFLFGCRWAHERADFIHCVEMAPEVQQSPASPSGSAGSSSPTGVAPAETPGLVFNRTWPGAAVHTTSLGVPGLEGDDGQAAFAFNRSMAQPRQVRRHAPAFSHDQLPQRQGQHARGMRHVASGPALMVSSPSTASPPGRHRPLGPPSPVSRRV
eukprot:TRINITY_DN11054_c0_g1_i1.p1 TRINITY_DN11054_c0_g1~~TRINITY_DN11054_c0_g1_i1.p1  ORF type:complete len:199 (-),score=7.62 TRINITY_DN11054_c0_g1_i1:37-633(-)